MGEEEWIGEGTGDSQASSKSLSQLLEAPWPRLNVETKQCFSLFWRKQTPKVINYIKRNTVREYCIKPHQQLSLVKLSLLLGVTFCKGPNNLNKTEFKQGVCWFQYLSADKWGRRSSDRCTQKSSGCLRSVCKTFLFLKNARVTCMWSLVITPV